MDHVLVTAWLGPLPSGPVHRVRVERGGPHALRRMQTLCGIRAVLVRLADDEPVSCERCLTRDGEPAVRMAEYLLVDARKRVTT